MEKNILEKPVYPFLFILYYLTHFYATNMASRPDILPILIFGAILCVLTGMGWFLLNLWMKDAKKSGLLTGILIFTALTFGHLQTALHAKPVWLEIAVWAGVLSISGILLWKVTRLGHSIAGMTRYINLTAIILVGLTVFQIAGYFSQLKSTSLKTESERVGGQKTEAALFALPDIYLIILDEYAREDSLKKYFGFDNSEFIQALEQRGFYVAKKSRGNYYMTKLSLAALLNAQYLDFLADNVGRESKDMMLLETMTRQSNIVTELKEMGYSYILVNSGSPPSDSSLQADAVISAGLSEELRAALTQGTIIRKVASKQMDVEHRRRFHFNLDEMKKIPVIPQPTFTFAHFIEPHAPYVFDRDGNPLSSAAFSFDKEAGEERYDPRYIEQLIYVNKRILELIDHILANSPEPPIIILQADHGYRAEVTKEPTPGFLLPASGILNALYVPGVDQEKFYETMTPINTFPFIFREYFHLNRDLQPDRSIFSVWDETPYKFEDVTELLDAAEKETAA